MVPVMVQVVVERILREQCARTTVAMETMNNPIRIAMAVLASFQRLPVAGTIFVRTAAVGTTVPTTVIVLVPRVVPMGLVH